MNPIYKFELNKGDATNLMDPETVQVVSTNVQTGRASGLIRVTPGRTYVVRNARGQNIPVWFTLFSGSMTIVATIAGATTTGVVPSGVVWLRMNFPLTYAAKEWGVFDSTTSGFQYYENKLAFPIFGDGLSKDYELQSNEQFFRAKLSGNLIFSGADYEWIVSQEFDFQYILTVFISYDAGGTWAEYWKGEFWKTDCEFDGDAETVTVQPSVLDQYTAVLAGLEKEYNLIDLLPEIVHVKADKRPMIQVYVPGQTVIGCFLSGMCWEQECEAVTNETQLRNTFHFALNKSVRECEISGNMTPALPVSMTGDASSSIYGTLTDGTYNIDVRLNTDDPENPYKEWRIIRIFDGVVLWRAISYAVGPTMPYSMTLAPVSGTGATGNVELYFRDINVFARYVCDVERIGNNSTYAIPADDFVGDNRNYHRVYPYSVNVIYFSTRLLETPTEWGIFQPGQYYAPPLSFYSSEYFPVARNAWGRMSIWFAFAAFDFIIEEQARAEFTLKDAYPLSSVISVLLGEIAPGVTHEASEDYSQFLYGITSVNATGQTLLITPKSNVIFSGYDQPAQKAPITLRKVLDMLRDCFRCYWFVDENNRFRVEHIQYFRNGGSYTGAPVVGVDLTAQEVTRNGKPWAFARNQYKFDKPEMAARYQFGWMDDVTKFFEGYPIDIVSKYVNPENIEDVNVQKFTSDIDYILLNPGEISKDGFVLLAAAKTNYISPESSYTNATRVVTVSGWSAGESVNLKFTAQSNVAGLTSIVTVAILDGSNNVLSTVGTFLAPEIGRTHTVENILVPEGAARLRFTASSSAGIRIDSLTGEYKLPYVNFRENGADHILQNAYVAFMYLQNYYRYDMPARTYKINGSQYMAAGIKKLKTQSLSFPALRDPDLFKFIRTGMGNGMIQKIALNLSSRNANVTLKYDTE